MSDQNLPEDSQQNSPQPKLPLEEITLTPGWVKSSTDSSYREHPGESRDNRTNRKSRKSDATGAREKKRRKQAPDGKRGFPPKNQGERANLNTQRRSVNGKARPQRDPHKKNDRPQYKIERVEPAPLEVAFHPEEKAFEALTAKMKGSTFAYSFFDVAKLILNKADRHQIYLQQKPSENGTRKPLYLILGSECVFLSDLDAREAVFRRHRNLLCKVAKINVEPPKGNFAFVNKCGFTGVVLCPPNYHDYQTLLVRHHQRRLAHVPFERVKARIETVNDPDAVNTWLESMSVQTFYECLHCNSTPPQTPVSNESGTSEHEESTQTEHSDCCQKFATIEELEKHITENHLDKIIECRKEVTISGGASRKQDDRGVREAIYQAWQSERRFPLKTANQMQGKLRHAGFHFFKDDKGITYVSPIKLKRFESGQVLTEEIQKIVTYVRANRGCTRKQLITGVVGQYEQMVAEEPESPQSKQSPSNTTGDPVQTQEQTPSSSPSSHQGENSPIVTDPATLSPTDQVLANLHWLIQDGYVVEFSPGKLWVAEEKKPQPPPTAQKQEEQIKQNEETPVSSESSELIVDKSQERGQALQNSVPVDMNVDKKLKETETTEADKKNRLGNQPSEEVPEVETSSANLPSDVPISDTPTKDMPISDTPTKTAE